MEKYKFDIEEERAIEYLQNDIRMNREAYKQSCFDESEIYYNV